MEQHFKPKSQDQLQAQVEEFGDKGVKEFSDDQKKILKYSSELAKIDDINNLPSDLSPELVELINSNQKRYGNFLCKLKEKKKEIQFKKENIELFKEKFEPAIKELKEKIEKNNAKDQYLGSGSNGDAYWIEIEGKKYAAKFSRSNVQANFEIKPLLRAKNIKNAAQLVAYSFDYNVVIMELLPGKDVTKFSYSNVPEYSDRDIIQLIETVKELDQNDIVIDPKPSNFIYDEKNGFSVLDFHLKKTNNNSLPESIIDLSTVLTTGKYEDHILSRSDYEDPNYKEKLAKQTIEWNKSYLPMMVRFLTIIQNKYPDILEEYKRIYAEKEANPRISSSPIIDREHIPTDHPDLIPHLKKLEEIGF